MAIEPAVMVCLLLLPPIALIILSVYELISHRLSEIKRLKAEIEFACYLLRKWGYLSDNSHENIVGLCKEVKWDLEELDRRRDYLFGLVHRAERIRKAEKIKKKAKESFKEENQTQRTPPKRPSTVQEMLGLRNGFSKEELKKSYRAWMMKNHPDKNPNADVKLIQTVNDWYAKERAR
ncbi:hypothetical protein HWC29_gp096 [Aeromonas phage 4_4572]|uniref:J domain-containing protein n=1 Tax=Aeromonas phage 4_4572 TaxID=2588517 RepID=A0A5B9NAM1_9CAUD|nr:hypothetical protein HWC29_gp096 [Aeromonas phage 4_4572]QEG09090.1 hypothetical protein [Aeromonas phage 4_4572]